MSDRPPAFDVPADDTQTFAILAGSIVADLVGGRHDVVLLRGLYNGEPRTFICIQGDIGGHSTSVLPVAMMFNTHNLDDISKISIDLGVAGVIAEGNMEVSANGYKISNVVPQAAPAP